MHKQKNHQNVHISFSTLRRYNHWRSILVL